MAPSRQRRDAPIKPGLDRLLKAFLISLIGGVICVFVATLVVATWFARAHNEPARLADDFMSNLQEGDFETAREQASGECFDEGSGSSTIEESDIVEYSLRQEGIDSRLDMASWDYDIVAFEGTMTIKTESSQTKESNFGFRVVSSPEWTICSFVVEDAAG